MSEPPKTRRATDLIHAGRIRTNLEENGEALFLTSGFTYESADMAEAVFANQVEHFQYSRFANPTVSMLEARLAKIEGAEACRATATGMAAVHSAIMCGLKAGSRVVASRALFGSCHWIVSTLLPQYGMESVFVDGADMEAWKLALSQPTALVLLESPSNPMLDIVDLRAVSALAHQAGAIVVVDNVFATPLLQKPLELGADVVVYSATKHMDGQGRVLGGAVLSSKKWIEEVFQPFFRNTGPSLSPFNAWVILKGLETLHLRVKAQSESAETIAQFLDTEPKIKRALYPTLASFKQRELAMRQMNGGGTLVTFELHGGKDEAFRMMNAFRVITISNNLGDTKSLATHPATTTHMRIGAEERAKLGITDGTIRLSVGLEDVEDLIEDLTQALAKV
ncbi:MAG: O-succinylhomoserine sulfhydrylase [Rhodospirillales bacterium]|nr:O-succinylhomoserine sulfhydrylase [Rhodospirillales bacterium]